MSEGSCAIKVQNAEEIPNVVRWPVALSLLPFLCYTTHTDTRASACQCQCVCVVYTVTKAEREIQFLGGTIEKNLGEEGSVVVGGRKEFKIVLCNKPPPPSSGIAVAVRCTHILQLLLGERSMPY